MGSMSIVHWMIVVGIVVLLFGKHKISDVMGDVAHGIKSFKKGMTDDEIASTQSDIVKQRADATPPTVLPSPATGGCNGER